MEGYDYDAAARTVKIGAVVHFLNLNGNDIDDEGVDALVGALLNNSRLQQLYLSSNHITARACQSLAALLTNTSSNLEELSLLDSSLVSREITGLTLCVTDIWREDERGAKSFLHANAMSRWIATAPRTHHWLLVVASF